MKTRPKRGSLYLLTGLLIGLALGLAIAWLLLPLERNNTSPADLRQNYKDQYRLMIASAYLANGDILRASKRLQLLGDPDPYLALADQAQRSLEQGNPPEEAHALGLLAVAMKQGSGQMASSQAAPSIQPPPVTPIPQQAQPSATNVTGSLTETVATTVAPAIVEKATPQPSSATPSVASTSVTPNAPVALASDSTASASTASTVLPRGARTATTTPSPSPIGTLTPTPTATRTPGAPFVLKSRQFSCTPALAQPEIQIQAFDASEQPVSGLEVIVTWDGGQERFYTGLKPEISPGYADFTLSPQTTYTVRLGDAGEAVSDLTAKSCQSGAGNTTWGAWQLIFKQP